VRTPEDIRRRMRATWQNNWTGWLGGAGKWPRPYALDPPTQDQARTNWTTFQRWLETWASPPDGAEIVRAGRSWSQMGQHQLPTHLVFHGPEALADFLGRAERILFEAADHRWRQCAAVWPDLADALRTHAEWLAGLSEADYPRFLAVIDWLSANPESGLYVRQLPILGVDTKWIDRNFGPVGKLLAIRTGRSGTFHQIAGLRVDGPRRRIRLLDETLRSKVGGLGDLNLPLEALAKLELPFRAAMVLENLHSLLALGDLPGTVAIAGGGYSVVELGALPWLSSIPLLYWGDIDAAGFGCLNALRAHHPHAESFLMDEATFQRHETLRGGDPAASFPVLPNLTPREQMMYARLAQLPDATQNRLEQERIPWESAWPALRSKVEMSLL
jgi:hypothetical protein